MSYTEPLALDGGYPLDKLCSKVLGADDYAVKKPKILPAREGEALIHKLELLKDTRFHHWLHEFVVLTLSYAGERRLLYLEHFWLANTGLKEWIPLTSSGLIGSQKPSADDAMFYKTDDPEEHERRRFTTTLLEIQFSDPPGSVHNPVTLRTVSKILRQLGTDHPTYALFSANCWAWSRGIVMAIVQESKNIQTATTMSRTGVTPDQLKFYLMTEYGAFGGLLLRCIAKGRQDLRWHEYYALRGVCILYGFSVHALRLKCVIFGPLNWTLRIRELCVHEDQTTDMNGQPHTYTVLPPDVTDLIPTPPGTALHVLGRNFCGPSKYLYVLTPPLASSGRRVTSVHIFIYGMVVLEPIQEQVPSADENILNRIEWFRCAILRPALDGRLVEVSEPACFSLKVHFRDKIGGWPYGGVYIMDHHHPFTLGLRQGDLIAIWALGRAGYVHKPAGAWIKVVANHPFGILDSLVAVDLLKTIMELIIYPRGHTRSEIVGKYYRELKHLFIEIPWCLNSWCNDWPWSQISMTALHLLSSVTPLQLPEDNLDDEQPIEIMLPEFIERLLSPRGGKGSSFCRAIVHSISLGQTCDGVFDSVILLATLGELEYYVHICHSKEDDSPWHHTISFLQNHVMQDKVVIYRPGKKEKASRQDVNITLKVVMPISDTTTSLDIRSSASRIRELMNSYWWIFWLNDEDWSWPIYILKVTMKCISSLSVQLGDSEEPLQTDEWEEINDILSERMEG